MPLDPPESQGPPRIVTPGGSPAEPEAAPGEPQIAGGEEPRIVLPPGAVVEETDDLPEYPRLRPLEILPVRDGDHTLLVVTDPLGVLRAPVALRFEALDLLQLLDGSLSLNELCALVTRESKDLRAARFVRELIGQLDHLLLLDSPRFQEVYGEVCHQYHQLEIRQGALEGVSYPGEPLEAEAFLGRHFEQAQKMQDGVMAASGAPPRALLVPHLDPRRAGPAIARGYLELERAPDGPLRVVVYGVGHSLFGDLFALTRKHFETPFGRVACDVRFVDALAGRLGDAAYRSELAHRDEHSIEFQALYLRHRFRERPITIVPILCGGFHSLPADDQGPGEHPEVEALIQAVGEAEKALGGATLHVAAVDLSHVGTRFGDPAPDERTRREVEEKDRTALEAARRGDAAGWYRAIAEHQDSTRVCGWAATYLMLRCARPGEGRLLHYEQSSENQASLVSIATLAWP